jgi:hypothetical protein
MSTRHIGSLSDAQIKTIMPNLAEKDIAELKSMHHGREDIHSFDVKDRS